MKNKPLIVGLGIFAAAGIAYYLYMKKKQTEPETNTNGKPLPKLTPIKLIPKATIAPTIVSRG